MRSFYELPPLKPFIIPKQFEELQFYGHILAPEGSLDPTTYASNLSVNNGEMLAIQLITTGKHGSFTTPKAAITYKN